MAEFTLNVQYITSKNCFCYLSEEYAKYAQERVSYEILLILQLCFMYFQNVVRVTIGEKTIYFSIGGLLPAPYKNTFAINPLYAKSLELVENNSVLVRFENNHLPIINSVVVSPLSGNDYEILVTLIAF